MFAKLFGAEVGSVLNYVFAFALVILLILAAFWLFRRFVYRGHFQFGPRTGDRRLAVVEASGVDAHRRLLLVRRDDVEHLLLVGGPSDIVVEANIDREAEIAAKTKARPVAAPRPQPQTPRPQETPQPAAAAQASPRPQPALQPQRPATPNPHAQTPQRSPSAPTPPASSPNDAARPASGERGPLRPLDWPGTSGSPSRPLSERGETPLKPRQ